MKEYYDAFVNNNIELLNKIKSFLFEYHEEVKKERLKKEHKYIHTQKIVDLFYKKIGDYNKNNDLINFNTNIDLQGYNQETEYLLRFDFIFKHKENPMTISFNIININEDIEIYMSKFQLILIEDNEVSFVLSDKQADLSFKNISSSDVFSFIKKDNKIQFKRDYSNYLTNMDFEHRNDFYNLFGLNREFRQVAVMCPEIMFNYYFLNKNIQEEDIDYYAITYDLDLKLDTFKFNKYRIDIRNLQLFSK